MFNKSKLGSEVRPKPQSILRCKPHQIVNKISPKKKKKKWYKTKLVMHHKQFWKFTTQQFKVDLQTNTEEIKTSVG